MVTVEEKDWYGFAKSLKETPGLEFDVLSAVVGMDWKDSLGVIYYLTSTSILNAHTYRRTSISGSCRQGCA